MNNLINRNINVLDLTLLLDTQLYNNSDFDYCISTYDTINTLIIHPNIKNLTIKNVIKINEIIIDTNNKLESLTFIDCKNFKIPINNLNKLKALIIKNTEYIYTKNFIKSIPSNLINLTELYVEHNDLIQEIPKELINLKTLTIKRCTKNINIPNTLINLEKLVLSRTKISKIPKELVNLKLLKVSYNDIITEIPKKLINIETLLLKKCLNLKEIPKELINIKTLHINKCSLIKKIPKELIKIKDLRLIQFKDEIGLISKYYTTLHLDKYQPLLQKIKNSNLTDKQKIKEFNSFISEEVEKYHSLQYISTKPNNQDFINVIGNFNDTYIKEIPETLINLEKVYIKNYGCNIKPNNIKILSLKKPGL